MMKKIILLLAGAAFFAQAFGQKEVSEEELIRSHFNLTKKTLVAEAMDLTNEQAKLFWPVYEKYNRESIDLTKERIGFLNEYAEKFDNITPEEADAILKKAFQYNKKVLAMEHKYYKLLKKELGVPVAVRFIHVEEYIRAAIKLELLDALPLLQDN